MGGNTASKTEPKYPQDKLVEKQEDERLLAQAAQRTISSLTRQHRVHTDNMATASTDLDSSVTHSHNTESQTPSNPTPSQAEDSDCSSVQAVLQTKDQPSPECDLHHHDKDATLSNVRACEDTSTSTNSDNESIKPPSPKRIKLSLSSQATDKSSQPHIAAAYSDRTRIFCEKDVCHLVEALVGHANKWREIGLMLGFTVNELSIIQSDPLKLVSNPPASYLIDMLNKWVQWTPQTRDGKCATLADLIAALQSELVGLAQVSEQVRRKFSEASELESKAGDSLGNTSSSIMPTAAQHTGSDTSASPISCFAYYLQSYYTRSRDRPKWPDLEPRDFINLAIISNEHKTHRDYEEFRKQTIRGSIDDITEAKSPIPFSDILQPNKIKGKEFEIKRILIEGAPGIGKSTMSWEICRKWGSGELFQEYSLVVLLRFRDPWVQKVKSVADLFRFPGSEPEMQRKIVKQINQTQGRNILLILEGFDEAPSALKEEGSAFFELFKGSLLPNATLMVTTRPSDSHNLRKYCKGNQSRRIEVLGFGKQEINEYVEMHIDDETLLHNFKQYLDMNPLIHNMMYVPLNCVIVTEIYKSCDTSSNAIVPKTMTQLYTSLVKTLLVRYMKEIPEYQNVQINDFSDLPHPVLEKFQKLCELAASRKIVFFNSDLPKDFDSLGLMQSYPELYIDKGASVSYSFLHLTIQEFLRAYCLKELITKAMDEEEIHWYYMSCRGTECRFLAGFLGRFLLMKISDPWTVDEFIATLSLEKDGGVVVSNSHLHLFFESQDPHIFSLIAKHFTGMNWFHVYAISDLPFDFYVLGYCIATSNCKWIIRECSGHPDNIKMMVKGMCSSFSCSIGSSSAIDSFHANSDFNDNSMQHLFEDHSEALDCIFKHMGELDVSKPFDIETRHPNSLTHIGCRHLADMLPKLQSLYKLDLSSNNSIGPGGAVELFKCLPISLKSLHMNNTGISEEDCKALKDRLISVADNSIERLHIDYLSAMSVQYIMDGLSHCTSLKTLDMSFSSFDHEAFKKLSSVLVKNKSMSTLYLNSCDIDSDSVAFFASKLNSISFLDLSNIVVQTRNTVGAKGAQELSKVLSNHDCEISTLNLMGCDLQDEGAVNLARGLTLNMSLTELNLNKNCIKNVGAEHLSKALTSNSWLRSLYLAGNSIQSDGAVCVAQMLETNTTLRELDLTSNNIKNEGIQRIARAINSNKNSSLRCLLVANNCIDDEGAKVFTEIKPTVMLKKIQLCYNPISEQMFEQIKLHQKSGSLKRLEADGNACISYNSLPSDATLEELEDERLFDGNNSQCVYSNYCDDYYNSYDSYLDDFPSLSWYDTDPESESEFY